MPKSRILKVLIVCSVNKGRSAAFSAYLKHFMRERGRANIRVDSAGTDKHLIKILQRAGKIGASSKVKTILSRGGVYEINSHRVKPITKNLVKESDLILAVSSKNKERILARYPEAEGKTFTVKEFVGIKRNQDIKDAHYHGKLDASGGIMYDKTTKKGTVEAYRKMLKEIRILAEMTAERLQNK